MAEGILSIGDGGRDAGTYDTATDGPMTLVGEGAIGDALVVQSGNQVRPQTPGGGGSVGDVSREGVTIDNRIARWHGTGADVQSSVVSINDDGNISGYGTLTGGVLGTQLVDSDGLLRILAIGQNGATDRQAMLWDDGGGTWVVDDILEPGAGTLNRIPLWTPDGDHLGDSDIEDDGNDVIVLTNDFIVALGRIGIGIPNPGRLLDIASTAPVIRFSDTNATNVTETVGFLEFGFTTGGWNRSGWIGYGSLTNDVLTMNNEDGSNIALMGADVGIGTTSPGAKLEVVGDVNLDDTLFVDIGGDVGIGVAPLANMAPGMMVLEGGAIVLKEITTPTADADYAKIYPKADNILYFQDGAGVEHTLPTGSGTDGTIPLWGAGGVTLGDSILTQLGAVVTVAAAAGGADVRLLVENTSDDASSSATIEIKCGISNADGPVLLFDYAALNWGWAIDNTLDGGAESGFILFSGTDAFEAANHVLTISNNNVGIGNIHSTLTELPVARLHIAQLNLQAQIALERIDTSISSGDIISEVETIGGVTLSLNEVARMVVQADADWAAGDSPTRMTFWTTPAGSTIALERLRISNTGDVSIGQNLTLPTGDLEVTAGSLGVGRAPLTDVHIAMVAPADLSTLAGSLFLESASNGGDGNYGAGVLFGQPNSGVSANFGAAIVAKQTAADVNQVGLAFITHPSASSGNPRVETMLLDHFGNLALHSGDLTIATGDVFVEAGSLGIGNAPTLPLDVKAKGGITSIGGYAIKLTNNTGSNTVEGHLVSASSSTAEAFDVAIANSDEVIGIVYESGVAHGSEAWVVVSGFAMVRVGAAGTALNDRLVSSAVPGIAVVNNIPAVAVHFQEVGHAVEAIGGIGLVKTVVHFN